MKTDNKTLLTLLGIALVILVVALVANVFISFVLALCVAHIALWCGNDVLMEHLPGLTVVIFIFYTFIIGTIEVNVKKES